MKTFWKWMAVFGAATAVDLFFRFGMPFRMPRVLTGEAILFPLTGFAFLYLIRTGPKASGWRRKLQIIIIAAFFLAGLRSALWVLGLPIMAVNMSVLAAAILTWLVLRRRNRAHS